MLQRNGLTVSIAVPEINGDRAIVLYNDTTHFHVVIDNVSGRPLRIWSTTYSSGYGALSFEWSDSKGRVHVAHRKPVEWRRNAPVYLTLDPGEKIVFDIHWGSGDWLDIPAPPKGASIRVPLQAIYHTRPSEEAKQSQVWTGRVVSEKRTYTVQNARS